MRLLLAGDFAFPTYEMAFAEALRSQGHEVKCFSWKRHFDGTIGKIEAHLGVAGICTKWMNRQLIACAAQFRPDATLVWRGTHVLPHTVEALRKVSGGVVASYNHDDPFSPYYRTSNSRHLRGAWEIFLRGIPHYDICFVPRRLNIPEYMGAGAQRVEISMQYFVPAIHFPAQLSPTERATYEADVVFIGHYENDLRAACMDELMAAGLKVRLFGTGWSDVGSRSSLGTIHPVQGRDYTLALRGAGMCLSFFSKLNRDTYTTRTFEIPATASLMLSEYSDDASALFEQRKHAVYFRSPRECVEMAMWLRADREARKAIASAGRAQCERGRHDVFSRAADLVECIWTAIDHK
jgi:spore maturation protein CgeB